MANKKVENIIIDAELLKLYSPVPLNLEEVKLYPFLISAQNNIRELIGNALVDELLFEIENDTLTQYNQALLIKIAPVLSAYTCYYALPSLAFQINQKGITKEKSDNSENVELKELNYLRLDIENQAERAAQELLRFLCDCSENYPLFDISLCPCKSSAINKLTYEIYFPNQKKGGCCCD